MDEGTPSRFFEVKPFSAQPLVLKKLFVSADQKWTGRNGKNRRLKNENK